MSREDLLRETMQRAVGGGPPLGDAYARFQSRQRRSARLRLLAAVGAGVTAMIALFMLLPGVGGEGAPNDLQATGTTRPHVEFPFRYIDREAKFEFVYPRYWDGERTEGSVVALFPDDPQLGKRYTDATFETPSIERPRRFYMLVRVLDREQAAARLTDIDAQERTGQVTVTRGTREFDGFRSDVRFLSYATELPPEDAKVREWCARCVINEYLMYWPKDVVLDVRFVGPDAETFAEHREEIEFVLKSFEYYGRAQK